MSTLRLVVPALAASLALSLGTGADAAQPPTTVTQPTTYSGPSVSGPNPSSTNVLAPGNYTFATSLTPRYFGGGSYLGVMNLRVAADGTIGGFFRYEDSSQIATVVGGMSKGDLWINYGPGLGSNHIFGRVDNGKIVGSTYFSGQPYDFVASQRTPGI
jgi:hypothetical protein